jgi:hypothetical protein
MLSRRRAGKTQESAQEEVTMATKNKKSAKLHKGKKLEKTKPLAVASTGFLKIDDANSQFLKVDAN